MADTQSDTPSLVGQEMDPRKHEGRAAENRVLHVQETEA